MSKIFITGASGFVGRNLIPNLLKDGHEIHALVRPDQFADRFYEQVNVIRGDLLQPSTYSDALHQLKPDIVIHMAAHTPVRLSWQQWYEFMQVNYYGTVYLLHTLRDIGHKPEFTIVYSTPEVLSSVNYSDRYVERTERAFVYPGSPYGISKLAAEIYCRIQPWIPCLVVRPANTYDRSILHNVNESRGYFVEKAVIEMLTSSHVKFDGAPDRVRTWMHVSDHVNAITLLVKNYSRLSQQLQTKPILHIAPPNSTLACFEIVQKLIPIISRYVTDVPKILWNVNPRPNDPVSITVDGRKFRKLFPEWSPKTVEQGLSVTVSNWRRVLAS